MSRESELKDVREAIQYHAEEINRIIDENSDADRFPRGVQLQGVTDSGERVRLTKITGPKTAWF